MLSKVPPSLIQLEILNDKGAVYLFKISTSVPNYEEVLICHLTCGHLIALFFMNYMIALFFMNYAIQYYDI